MVIYEPLDVPKIQITPEQEQQIVETFLKYVKETKSSNNQEEE